MKNKRKIRKIICTVLVIAVLAGIFAAVTVYQNTRYIISEYTFASDRLPDSFIGYRIAHISDLHGYEWDGLCDSVRDGEPDIIVITGDIIGYEDTDVSGALDTVRALCDIAPVYYVTGNHEYLSFKYYKLRNGMTDAGVHILANEAEDIVIGDDRIRICGLHDPSFATGEDAKHDEMQTALDQKLGSIMNGEGDFTILLAHRPEYYPLYSAYSVDLTFSGHAHGGAVCLPLIGALFAPGQGLLPGLVEGLHADEKSAIVISRGLGDSTAPFRVNCPYELVFVTLTQGDLDMIKGE